MRDSWGRSLFPWICLLTILIGGCLRHKHCVVDKQSTGQEDIEVAVVQAVRDWYLSNGYQVPHRIVIKERGNEVWKLNAEPEAVNTYLEVDPITKQVIKVIPGF